MTAVDLTIMISLIVFWAVWVFANRLGFGHLGRRVLLALSATLALAAACYGVFDDRWQNAVGGFVAFLLFLWALFGRQHGVANRRCSGAVIALLLLLSYLPIYLFPVPDLPPPSGPHPVGTISFELSDDRRRGVFLAKHDEARRLLVRAWYPAGKLDGLETRPYFTELGAKTTLSQLGRLFGAPFLFRYFKHSKSNSYTNAPILEHADKLPVVMYSHGYTGSAGQNTVLMEELASHGYAVYSIQHTYDASDTVFPNGDVLVLDPALATPPEQSSTISAVEKQAYMGRNFDQRYAGQVEARRESLANKERISTQSTQVWLDDRRFVLDSLQTGLVPEQAAKLVAASDFSRTGQMGMSFGGSTTGRLCMVDRRCAAAVNLDGGGYHSTPVGKNMPVPLLMLYSDFKYIKRYAGGEPDVEPRGFNDFSYELLELAGQRDDVYRLMVSEVMHVGFSDFTLFLRNPLRALLFGAIAPETMLPIQNTLVRGFFDTHLLGKEVAFPDAQLAKFSPHLHRSDISDIRDWWLDKHPEDRTEGVLFETDRGDIELALYPERAPIAVQQFLSAIKEGVGEGFDVVKNVALHDTVSTQSKTPTQRFVQLGVMPSPQHLEQSGIPIESGTTLLVEAAGGGKVWVCTSNDENCEENDMRYTSFGRIVRGLRLLEHVDDISTLPVQSIRKMLIAGSATKPKQGS